MPIYEYECPKCQHRQEERQKTKAAAGDRVQQAALFARYVITGPSCVESKIAGNKHQHDFSHGGREQPARGGQAAADQLAEALGIDVLDKSGGTRQAPGHRQYHHGQRADLPDRRWPRVDHQRSEPVLTHRSRSRRGGLAGGLADGGAHGLSSR